MARYGRRRCRGFLLAAAMAPAGLGMAAAEEKPKGDVYTLETCPISGKKLGAMGDPVVKAYDGREVRFCCTECPEKFEKDKAVFLKKIDEAIVRQQKPLYPVDTCVVSGEKFGGDMGEPVDYVHDNRLVRFCCKSCIKKFTKEPAKHLAKLDKAAIAKQKPAYPLDTCPVSGDKLGGDMGEPIDKVFGGRLVRFCCKDCDKDFRKEPAKFLNKIDEAAKEKEKGSQKHEHEK